MKLRESGGPGEQRGLETPLLPHFFFSFNFAEAEEDRRAVNHGRVERERKTERQKAPTYYARREYNYVGDLKAL